MSYSFSDLNTAQRCLKAHYYRSIVKIQRVKKDDAMYQGTIMHGFLMKGFLNLQNDMHWREGFDHELDLCLKADEFGENQEMIMESIRIVERYFKQDNWDDWEILHVEEEFTCVINGQNVTFTPDLVARSLATKAVWVFDHKSTSSVPQDGVPFASQQSLLYLAGVKVFYPEAVGFVFNFLRKKLPTQPRLNKTKKREAEFYAINNLNKIDTTFEILMDFVRSEASNLFGDLDTKRRLAELRDNPSKFFYKEMVMVSDAALLNIVDDTAMVIDNLKYSEEKEEYPRTLNEDGGYRSCGRCEFSAICRAEMLDWNTDIVLEMYEDRDPKNEYGSEDT